MPEDSQWNQYATRFNTNPALIAEKPLREISMIICIPVYAEPAIQATLDSLSGCVVPDFCSIEIILLFNKDVNMTSAEEIIHVRSQKECQDWIKTKNLERMVVFPVDIGSFPDPKGGVGWARKLVMDEAARRLGPEGIIVCLDADCIVDSNYFEEISAQFAEFPLMDAASIHFEHPYENLGEDERNAIIDYELHLRYLVHAQRWCGHPFAFQTIGSSMAVRRNVYMAQGGMNTRRAGEDFYFLQKFIENGRAMEIKKTTVYPSPRISHRVPFGTGRAMNKSLTEDQPWTTTDFRTFESIKPLFESLLVLWDLGQELRNDYGELAKKCLLNDAVIKYLQQTEFLPQLASIRSHTGSYPAFIKRFFRFFNAFAMIRFMHYMRDHHYPNVPVVEAVQSLYNKMDFTTPGMGSAEDYLRQMRQQDRN